MYVFLNGTYISSNVSVTFDSRAFEVISHLEFLQRERSRTRSLLWSRLIDTLRNLNPLRFKANEAHGSQRSPSGGPQEQIPNAA